MWRNKLIIVGIMMLGITFAIQLLDQEKKVYGNDRESIVNVIHSIDGYEHAEVILLDVRDFGDYRVAGFLSDQTPSSIEFHKNKDGNYTWQQVESHEDDKYAVFLPTLFGTEKRSMMIISKSRNGISKLQVDVNGERMEADMNPDISNVKWITLPESSTGSYEFRHYKMYDKDGKLME
ncbi:hypothetical protein [Paenibacillus sp. HB172176]|uniref:hypothetical protein n=1 Tax=Paenibacillus sp. HB172176 TaxID=2493690 RepID=UPI001439F8F9|nr:hypothetical protein [Paenibacillus sp. HB172176]